jgi:hypothetical protein
MTDTEPRRRDRCVERTTGEDMKKPTKDFPGMRAIVREQIDMRFDELAEAGEEFLCEMDVSEKDAELFANRWREVVNGFKSMLP